MAERYGVQSIKLTSAQRMALIGIREEELDNARADLAQPPGAIIGLCVRSVKICPGTTYCKRGLQDSMGLGVSHHEYFVRNHRECRLRPEEQGPIEKFPEWDVQVLKNHFLTYFAQES